MMKKTVLGAAGLAALAAAGLGGVVYSQQDDVARVESLCAADPSDAAEAARAQNLALVDVVERGRFVTKGDDGAGLQTFRVRTVAVFKGTLPGETEIGLPQGAPEQLRAGSRYEVSVLGPEQGTWFTRFVRPVPAGKTAEAVAAHWKREIAKKYVEKPCGDISTS
ncbi:hypothetical protein [Streptomyces sp. NPDC018711]|uniref:hypothetical protein n=1 Tax=Streptomyces sp. NPDC018711 TaxID=3365052 RepID=UPI0037902DBA